MYSRPMKFIFTGIALLLMSISLVNCSLMTGEEAYDPKVPVIDSDFSCLDNVGVRFEKYFDSDLSDKEIVEFFDCAKNAMRTFKDRTDGIESGYYTPEELRVYFEKFFIKNNEISDKLLLEAMRIKQTMVGGSLINLTKPEIEKGIELLDLIKEKALLARPYMFVFNLEGEKVPTLENLNKAFNVLQTIATSFGNELAKNVHSYDFESFNSFLHEFRKFLNWESSDVTSEHYYKITDWIELSKAFKNVIFDSNKMKMSSNEWRPFLQQGMSWYSVYLRFKYTVSGWQILYGQGLENLNQMVESVFSNLRSLFLYQRPTTIKYERIFKVATALQRLKMMPFGIQAVTVQKVFPLYIKRGFVQVNKPLSQRSNDGLNLEAVENLHFEYQLWLKIQKTLDAGKTPENKVIFEKKYNLVDVNECSHQIKPIRYVNYECELARIRNERPMFKDNYDTAYVIRTQDITDNNFINLSRLNVVRLAVRVLILSFGSYETQKEMENTLNQHGITRSQLEEFYVKTKPLGIDMKLMDPRGNKVGERAFMEGKLFTYAGKGLNLEDPKDLITYSEITQLLSVLYSGGRVGKLTYAKLMKEACPESGEVDVFGSPKIFFKCFKENFGRYMYQYLGTCVSGDDSIKCPREGDSGTLPGMHDYLEGLPEVEYEELREVFFRGALGKNFDGVHVELGDFTFMYVVLHYIEITMTHFDDTPADETITFIEAAEAYKRFRVLFENFADKMLSDKTFGVLGDDADEVIVEEVKTSESLPANFTVNQAGVKKDSLNPAAILGTLETDKVVEKYKDSPGWKQEFVKAYFYLLLAKDGDPGVLAPAWEVARVKMGLDYSSDIKNLKVDRKKLLKVFMLMVALITNSGDSDDDGETPVTEPEPPVTPIEDDIRYPDKDTDEVAP